MNNIENIESLFEQDIKDVLIRDFVKLKVDNFNDKETYVIYDGAIVERYSPSIFELKKSAKSFKTYYISKPIKIF